MSEDVVWIDVLPAMDKFGPALGSGADQAATATGKKAGSKFGLAMVAGVAAVAGGAVLAGKALYNVGREFDEMSDIIHIGSGAVGDDLDALVESAKTVGTRVPADFDQIGAAIANFNTYVGATGEPLERLTTQVMEASRLLGEDGVKNSESFGKAMRQWGIDAEDGADLMDVMYVATQGYGVGLDKLSGHLERNSATLQNAGFSAEEAVGFFAQLEAGGVQVTRVMPGLNAAFRKWSEEGKNSKEEMQRVSEAMKNASSDAEALNIASENFGAQGAQRLTTAIRSGVLELDDLTGAFADADGAIATSAEETRSFEESWAIFKNTLKVAVEPAATAIFDLISSGMQWINDNAIPWIDRMKEAWENSEGPVGQVREVFDQVWSFLQENLVPIFMTMVDYIRENVIPFISQLVGVVKDTMLPIFNDVWNMFREKVLPILQSVADFIVQRVVPVVKDFAERVAMPLFRAVGDAISDMWKVVQPIFDLLWTVLRDHVGPTIEWLWSKVVEPTFKWIGDAVEGFGDKWGSVWDGIKATAARPVNFIIDTVYNNGIRKALNFLPGVNLQRASRISGFRHGGYTGHGHPDAPAGIVHAGEYVFTYEEVRRMGGPAGVERLKRSALSEMELDLPGYRAGGPVRPVPQGHSGWNGGRYRSGGWHGGLDFPAPLGTAIRALLPGIVSAVVHLTRSYGKHVRVDHGGGLQTLYAHMQRTMVGRGQGVGAGTQLGTVNSTGNSTGHHLHFEVRQGGRQVNPEPYLSGAASGGDGGDSARIWDIPGIIRQTIRDIREGLTGEWGELLRGGVLGVVNDVRDWAKDRLGPLGSLVFGGYAGGTAHARPGWSWVGEHGPELVRFRGGERVLPHMESLRATAERSLRIGELNLQLPEWARNFDDLIAFLRDFPMEVHQS